jgi:hypothetical protein
MKKIAFCLLLTIAISAQATVRHVPASFATIQLALNACVAGDTVQVQLGTYPENIVWPAVNSIKLLGNGSFGTIITASGSGRVMYINSPLIDTTTVISGFTLIDGLLMGGNLAYGAGLYIEDASIKMSDILVMGNRAFVSGGHGSGGGMYMKNSSSIIENCYFLANSIDSSTWGYGGGVYVEGGSPAFRNVNISSNLLVSDSWCYGGGMYVTDAASLELTNVNISGNITGNNSTWYYGTGLYANDVIAASLVNVLVSMNTSGTGGTFNDGGGIYFDGDTTNAMLMNVTVAENKKTANGAIDGSGIFVRNAYVTAVNCISYNPNSAPEIEVSGTGTISFLWSDVRGGAPGIGNINAVPAFVSSSDFHLAPTSPCAGTGTANGAPFVDLDLFPRPMPVWANPDMGCYEVDESVTGINEPVVSDFNVFPNPTATESWITIPSRDDETWMLDATGRIVGVYPVSYENRIFIGDVAPGIYVLQQLTKPAMRLVVTGRE